MSIKNIWVIKFAKKAVSRKINKLVIALDYFLKVKCYFLNLIVYDK